MAKSREVQIKGTRNGLVIILNPTCDVEELKQGLLRQLENARDFFRGARFTFYHGKKDLSAEYKQELLRIVAEYGLVYEEKSILPAAQEATSRKAAEPALDIGLPRRARTQTGSAVPIEPPLPVGAGQALLVRQSLRSGQSVVTEKHFVITGDVHAGASVNAAGSIVVLGTLSGVANAGIYGDRSAVVFSRKFAPTALSIAGIAAAPPVKPLVDGKAILKGKTIIYSSKKKSEVGIQHSQ